MPQQEAEALAAKYKYLEEPGYEVWGDERISIHILRIEACNLWRDFKRHGWLGNEPEHDNAPAYIGDIPMPSSEDDWGVVVTMTQKVCEHRDWLKVEHDSYPFTHCLLGDLDFLIADLKS